MKTYLLFLLLFCFSCKNSSVKKDDVFLDSKKESFVIVDSCIMDDSISLYLCESNNKSLVKILQNNELYLTEPLLLTAPCRFLREHNEIQSHSFNRINVNHVIFIAGDKKLSAQKYSAIQGIVFKKDSIVISQRKIEIEIDDNQWIDGKFFLDAAYYP
jgi:hypothetical protein